MINGYVVVSIDAGEIEAVYFNDYKKAVKYIRFVWETSIETEKNIGLYDIIEDDTYCNENYATIYYEDGSITEFFLKELSSPINGFEDYNY